MKNKFLQTKKEVTAWLKEFSVSGYTINDDLTVDIDGVVNLSGKKLDFIPIKFGIVSGWFDCRDNKLTSLKFAPETVGGSFNCSGNLLTSLMFAPVVVGGGFYCNDNKITSLEFTPNVVGFNFDCSDNKLTSLEFCPKQVGGGFYCSNNKITSLKYCPEVVAGGFFCTGNRKLGELQNVFEFRFFMEEQKRLKVVDLEKKYGGKNNRIKKSKV